MSSSFTAEQTNAGLPKLPSPLAPLLERNWSRVTLGLSDASVWRIEGDGQTMFLKVAPVHPLSEQPGEVRRLRWLAEIGIAAPLVQQALEANGFHWLLMTAVPGADLTTSVDGPATLCQALADALRTLHALDPSDCPFDHSIDARLAAAEANIMADRVDESDFDDTHAGWSAQDVLAWLRDNRPPIQDLVVTHGDASLPNIMADGATFTGIVDCGRLGVADRWQDLALACWSIIYNCGEAHVATFLAAYGVEWDAERYRYYCALDELF